MGSHLFTVHGSLFMLTIRGLILILITAPLVAMTALLGLPEWLGWLWVLFALFALWLDWRLAQGVTQFDVRRVHDTRLSLGVENRITVELRNRSNRAIEFAVRDEPPPRFQFEDTYRQGRVGPRETWQGNYMVLPPKRGDYRFGDVHVRWSGPLGLIRRQADTETSGPVKVYPNLIDVRKYDLLLRQNRLRELGLRHTRLTGEGTEFEGLREYRQDDEFRRINWKATARRRRPVTIEYQTERSQNIMAVVDIGRMMQSPVGLMSKLDYVLNAVLLLTYVSGGMGDRVGLLTFADTVQTFIPPKGGRSQFYKMLELLYKVEPQGVEPAYRQALNYLSFKQRRRSLMLLFTDLSSGYGMDELLANVALLSKTHLVLVVTIQDPDVTRLASRVPKTGEALYQKMTAERLLEKRQLGLDRLHQHGVYTLDVPADKLSISVIDRYLDLKMKMRI